MIPSRSTILLRLFVLLYDVIARLLSIFHFLSNCDGFFLHEKNKLMGELVKCTETEQQKRILGMGMSEKPGAKQIRLEPWKKQSRGKGF